MSPGQVKQVCSLELFPGGTEWEGETPGSLDSAGVYRHALSLTCVGLLHPAFQPALQSGWFCLLQSVSPLAQVVLMFCGAQQRYTGQPCLPA